MAFDPLAPEGLPPPPLDYDERSRRIDYGSVFGSEAGQRVLADLGRFGHVWHQTAVQDRDGRLDPSGMIFLEGQRSVVLRILAILRTNPGEKRKETSHDD